MATPSNLISSLFPSGKLHVLGCDGHDSLGSLGFCRTPTAAAATAALGLGPCLFSGTEE